MWQNGADSNRALPHVIMTLALAAMYNELVGPENRCERRRARHGAVDEAAVRSDQLCVRSAWMVVGMCTYHRLQPSCWESPCRNLHGSVRLYLFIPE